MTNNFKLLVSIILTILVLLLSIGVGSVYVPPLQIIDIIGINLFGQSFSPTSEIYSAIIWKIRLPRVMLAFICGAGLSVSGVVMQSILKNSLASSYTLGVSAGSAVGASIVILFKISIFGIFTLQVFGSVFGLLTIILAMVLANKIDKTMNDNIIILMGMAFSLFANAILSIFMAFAGESLQTLVFWQMGSFSSKDVSYTIVLYPLIFLVSFFIFLKSQEMDILTFGDEHANITGVDVVKTKWYLIILSSISTGFVISVCGIIGFVDLFIPHVCRNIFGANHKYLIPSSFIIGGTFMVICDLISRIILDNMEIPVGTVTAIIGAPFFVHLYLVNSKNI